MHCTNAASIEKYEILQYENISNSLWFITIYPSNEWIWIMMVISGSIINGWKTCNDDSCWRSIRATTAGLFYITFLSMQCGNTAKMILDLTSVTIYSISTYVYRISTMYIHLCRHRYRKPHLLFWVRMSPWYRQLMVACTSFYSSCSKWYDDLSYQFLSMTYNICRYGLHNYRNQMSCIQTYPRGRKLTCIIFHEFHGRKICEVINYWDNYWNLLTDN